MTYYVHLSGTWTWPFDLTSCCSQRLDQTFRWTPRKLSCPLTRRNPPTVWTKNDPIHGAAPGVPNLWHNDQGSISQMNGKVAQFFFFLFLFVLVPVLWNEFIRFVGWAANIYVRIWTPLSLSGWKGVAEGRECSEACVAALAGSGERNTI